MEPHIVGAVIAICIAAAVVFTINWMLHPPVTRAERVAREAAAQVDELIGSVLIVFSDEIHSENMTALAARLARREKAALLAVYIVEVPLTLPMDAEMQGEQRAALDVLANAEAIARQNNVEIKTEVVPARKVSEGVVALVKRRGVHLVVMGSYREGRYAGAPIGKQIEAITSLAPCDVLIGVAAAGSTLLQPPANATAPAGVATNGDG